MKLLTVFSASRAFKIVGSGDEPVEDERIRKSEYGQRLKFSVFRLKNRHFSYLSKACNAVTHRSLQKRSITILGFDLMKKLMVSRV